MNMFVTTLRKMAKPGGKVEVEATVLKEVAQRIEQLERECERWRRLAQRD
jgi:hypothetical protein